MGKTTTVNDPNQTLAAYHIALKGAMIVRLTKSHGATAPGRAYGRRSPVRGVRASRDL